MYFIDGFQNCYDVAPKLTEVRPRHASHLVRPLPITTPTGYVTASFHSFVIVREVILTLWPGAHPVPLVCGARLRAALLSAISRTNSASAPMSDLDPTFVHPISRSCDQSMWAASLVWAWVWIVGLGLGSGLSCRLRRAACPILVQLNRTN